MEEQLATFYGNSGNRRADISKIVDDKHKIYYRVNGYILNEKNHMMLIKSEKFYVEEMANNYAKMFTWRD